MVGKIEIVGEDVGRILVKSTGQASMLMLCSYH